MNSGCVQVNEMGSGKRRLYSVCIRYQLPPKNHTKHTAQDVVKHNSGPNSQYNLHAYLPETVCTPPRDCIHIWRVGRLLTKVCLERCAWRLEPASQQRMQPHDPSAGFRPHHQTHRCDDAPPSCTGTPALSGDRTCWRPAEPARLVRRGLGLGPGARGVRQTLNSYALDATGMHTLHTCTERNTHRTVFPPFRDHGNVYRIQEFNRATETRNMRHTIACSSTRTQPNRHEHGLAP